VSIPENGHVLPPGSDPFSPARGRPGARLRGFGSSDRHRIGAPEPVRKIVTTEAKLNKWFESALPGDRFIYHVGNLAADRATETSQLPVNERRTLEHIARLIMAAVAMGWLTTAQRRRDDGHIDYIAIRVTARRPETQGAARWA
jgi:hypothetical protein